MLMVPATVDAGDAHAQLLATLIAVTREQHMIEQFPNVLLRRIPRQHLETDRPGLLVCAEANDLHLEPI